MPCKLGKKHVIGASLSLPHIDVMYVNCVCGWTCAASSADKMLLGVVDTAYKVFTSSN